MRDSRTMSIHEQRQYRHNLRAALGATLALMAGYYLATATHECGHAIAASLLGGKVLSIQPWAFLGPTETVACGRTDLHQCIVLAFPLFLTTGSAIIALLAAPWSRFPSIVVVALALFLLPFIS